MRRDWARTAPATQAAHPIRRPRDLSLSRRAPVPQIAVPRYPTRVGSATAVRTGLRQRQPRAARGGAQNMLLLHRLLPPLPHLPESFVPQRGAATPERIVAIENYAPFRTSERRTPQASSDDLLV